MRQVRQWTDKSKAKLSASLRGKTKKPQHKQRISQSMRNYWASVPSLDKLDAIAQEDDDDIITGKMKEPKGAHQPVPPEPTIVTDHGIWEEIVRDVLKNMDLTTYQSEENVKNDTKK